MKRTKREVWNKVLPLPPQIGDLVMLASSFKSEDRNVYVITNLEEQKIPFEKFVGVICKIRSLGTTQIYSVRWIADNRPLDEDKTQYSWCEDFFKVVG
jgi:hypothetical protein